MATNISSIGLKGLQGYRVTVEVELLPGTDSVVIVGLPDTKIFRLARTISDLQDEECITDESLWEALTFRLSPHSKWRTVSKVSGR